MLSRAMYPDISPLWELYEVHLDEAEFLAGQWERALRASSGSWLRVVAWERRLLAHVDALTLGGASVARRLLLPALDSEDASREMVAALALLSEGGVGGREAVVEAFLDGPPASRPGLQRALELCGREEVLLHFVGPLRSVHTSPDVLRAALELHVAHRRSVPGGVELEALWDSAEPRLAVAVCRMLPLMTPLAASMLRKLMQALDSPERVLRDAALAVGMVLGLREAWARCRRIVESSDSPGGLPLLLFAMGSEVKGVEWLVGRLANPTGRADVVWALGHCGRMAGAEACLDWLDDPDPRVARLATESFVSVTGFPLEAPHVAPEEEPSEEEQSEPHDDLDEEREVEATLPRVRPDVARAWWKRQRFDSKARYLGGRVLGATGLTEAFGWSPPRRWAALTLELAIRSRGRHQVSPRAFSHSLQRQLAQVKGFAPRGEQSFISFLDQ